MVERTIIQNKRWNGPQSVISYLFSFQASGLVMLVIGVWMMSQLHKYVDTESPIATTLPIIFLGLSAAILLLAALACCCTAKGKVPLLYLVSFIQFQFILVTGVKKSYIPNVQIGWVNFWILWSPRLVVLDFEKYASFSLKSHLGSFVIVFVKENLENQEEGFLCPHNVLELEK